MSIYMGIDWSQDKHDVAFMNEAGIEPLGLRGFFGTCCPEGSNDL
jgi:hypothetical protein